MSDTVILCASSARPVCRRGVAADRALGVIMALFLLAGACLAIAALYGPSNRRRLADTLTLPGFLSGKTAAAVNDIAAHHLPGGDLLRMLGGIWRWRLFGSGGPEVWVGRDGWLFYMDELRPWPDADQAMQQRADLLHRIAAALATRHIALLVVLVPDKARIMLPLVDGPRSAQASARYDAFTALLNARHIPVVSLAAPFAAAPGPLYYRTDTHWNEAGAALAAAMVAVTIQTPIDHSHVYRTDADPAWSKVNGDLLRLMSLEHVPDDLIIPLRPRAEYEHRDRTTEAGPPPAPIGLLEAPSPVDVALLGTSSSRNGNFDGELRQALHTPIGNFSQIGGGFAGSANSYFLGDAFAEHPPKLVIWEIPERLIGQPLQAGESALADLPASIRSDNSGNDNSGNDNSGNEE